MQILTYRVEKNKMFLYKIAKRFGIHRFFCSFIIIKGKTKMRLKTTLNRIYPTKQCMSKFYSLEYACQLQKEGGYKYRKCRGNGGEYYELTCQLCVGAHLLSHGNA